MGHRTLLRRAPTSPISPSLGWVGATQPMVFSADETTDIGYESGTDDHDHFIDPDERLRIAMARQ